MIVCNYYVEDEWLVVGPHTYYKAIQHISFTELQGNIIIFHSTDSNEYCIRISVESFNEAYKIMYHPCLGDNKVLHYYVSSMEQGKEKVNEFLNKLQRLKVFL